MAQNITLLGASYSDVPAVELPKTGGGTARFDDVTVTTATAEDVAQGKVFVASDGTITTGTGTGGSDSMSTINMLDGVELHKGYITKDGGISQQSSGGQHEYYSDEIDVSEYRGQRIWLICSLSESKQQWLGISFYNESHTFRTRSIAINNVTATTVMGSVTVGSTDSYIRPAFRAWTGCTVFIFLDSNSSVFKKLLTDAGCTVVIPN